MNGQEISLEALAVEHSRAVCLLIGESGCNPPLGGPKKECGHARRDQTKLLWGIKPPVWDENKRCIF